MIDNDFQIEYCRINLAKTNYSLLDSFKLITDPNVGQLQEIFVKYCKYKQFISVEPMWDLEFIWQHNDVLGYYDHTKLVAWSVVTKYNDNDVYSVQFAWDYESPELELGNKSLRSECAYYKNLGYRYYYLGEAHKYKQDIDGFEVINGYL